MPAALLVVACSPSPEPAPEASPTPSVTPVPTPNPALGATQAAIKLYPDLGNKDSAFNHTFRDLYVERTKTDPAFLARAVWPLDLARETASMVGVAPTITSPTPSPTPPVTPTPSPTWFQQRQQQGTGILDAPAYNQQRIDHAPAPLIPPLASPY